MASESYLQHIHPAVVVQVKREWEDTGTQYQFIWSDIALCHKAPSAREYLSTHGIEPRPWLAFSQDPNPIANVWSLMN